MSGKCTLAANSTAEDFTLTTLQPAFKAPCFDHPIQQTEIAPGRGGGFFPLLRKGSVLTHFTNFTTLHRIYHGTPSGLKEKRMELQ